jgi:hypothetical protein
MSYGQMSYGQMSYGQMSYGQMSYGQMSYGQMSYSQMSFGQMYYRQMFLAKCLTPKVFCPNVLWPNDFRPKRSRELTFLSTSKGFFVVLRLLVKQDFDRKTFVQVTLGRQDNWSTQSGPDHLVYNEMVGKT